MLYSVIQLTSSSVEIGYRSMLLHFCFTPVTSDVWTPLYTTVHHNDDSKTSSFPRSFWLRRSKTKKYLIFLINADFLCMKDRENIVIILKSRVNDATVMCLSWWIIITKIRSGGTAYPNRNYSKNSFTNGQRPVRSWPNYGAASRSDVILPKNTSAAAINHQSNNIFTHTQARNRRRSKGRCQQPIIINKRINGQ